MAMAMANANVTDSKTNLIYVYESYHDANV